MGLLTDIFFKEALTSDEQLMAALPAHNVYNNVAYPDVDMDNVKMPYVIVNNDGGSNEGTTKDDLEGTEDRTSISIRVVGTTREQLADLMMHVRKTVHDYIQTVFNRINTDQQQAHDYLCPDDYTVSFSEVAYDVMKGSHTQILYYQCDTPNEILYEQETTGTPGD